jgi:hypothetical protein
MPSLLEFSDVFEDQTARRRVKSAMRIIASEVRSEIMAPDATAEEAANFVKRRKVAARWREATAHWLDAIIASIADEPSIIALGQKPAKADDQLAGPAQVKAVDDAILAAVRAAVDEWRDRV